MTPHAESHQFFPKSIVRLVCRILSLPLEKAAIPARIVMPDNFKHNG
jgi:hypothetical protein